MSHRILKGVLCAVLLVIAVDACTEQVTGSLGCPALCADESAALRDTILPASIVLDSTLVNFPRLGEGANITLLNRGDTADVRLIARFDSLPFSYNTTATTEALISRVDSATLSFAIDTASAKRSAPLTIEAFDVDTTAADTLPATLLPLFRASRLLASQTFNASDLSDTVKLKLDNAKILKKVTDTLRLRIGLRISGPGSTRLRVVTSTYSPRIRFRVSADTAIKPDTVFIRSKTPTDDSYLQTALGLYPLIAKGALPIPPAGTFAVGGLAGARTYLKFDIPAGVIDSVQVIRASLLLTQRPARSTARVKDSVWVYTHPVLASPLITDVTTLMSFFGSPVNYGVDSVLFTPSDSGLKSLELVNLFRFWHAAGSRNSNRSIILRSPAEGGQAGDAEFFSLEAPANLRPRLRITYVPRRGFGLP